jgi:hypothetical protein
MHKSKLFSFLAPWRFLFLPSTSCRLLFLICVIRESLWLNLLRSELCVQQSEGPKLKRPPLEGGRYRSRPVPRSVRESLQNSDVAFGEDTPLCS